MIGFFVAFWTIIIFLSITWYAILLFYVGLKGGKEIQVMTRKMERDDRPDQELKT